MSSVGLVAILALRVGRNFHEVSGFNAWGFVKKRVRGHIGLRDRGLETLTVWMYKEEDEPNVPRRGSRKRASAKFSPP